MITTFPSSHNVSQTVLDKLRKEMQAAKPLRLNSLVDEAELNAIANGAVPGAGIHFVTESIVSVEHPHWYKLEPNLPAQTEYEFRTLYRRPSALPTEELLVRVFALNSAGEFLSAHGGPIGSSVAHGTAGAALGISKRAFVGSGTFPVYYFRIRLIGNGVPPANPYLLFPYRLTA